jgi:hypothetical protein
VGKTHVFKRGNNMRNKIIVSSVLLTFVLGGCANMTETQKGTAKGAAIGAGAGAVVGALQVKAKVQQLAQQ